MYIEGKIRERKREMAGDPSKVSFDEVRNVKVDHWTRYGLCKFIVTECMCSDM